MSLEGDLPPNSAAGANVRLVPLVMGTMAAGILAGCLHRHCACDREGVADQVAARMGQRPGPATPCATPEFPPGFEPGQPLEEDHAVLVALWANPGFQELLTDLRITRADLIQAGLLPNPEVVYIFSAPHKPFKYLVDFALESLWLRPIRIAASEAENERVCSRLVQNALDLIRDTRQAFADVLLARDRLKVGEDLRDLRVRIGGLAEARLRA